MKSTRLAAALVGALLSTSALATENGDITNVTMSSGGLVEIVRKATISKDGTIRMEVPIEQVNDVLKSVVVFDKSGSVEGLSLPGPNPLHETFKKLPFTVQDLQSPGALLSKLQGTEVEVEHKGVSHSGSVLGVAKQDNGDLGSVDVVSILDSEREIKSLVLEPGANITFKDEDVKAKIANALSVVGDGKVDGAREVSIRIAGDGEREVSVSYVVPAPIWKTAYRVVTQEDGKARLQAWAVLENASGEDWSQVQVTLSSGAPVTLKQQLHSLYWKERTEVPIDTSAGYVPPADPGAAPAPMFEKRERGWSRNEGAGIMTSSLALADEEIPRQDMAAANVGEVTEGSVTASFEIPWLVDLKNGQTLSAPIVDTVVSAEEVSVFRAEYGQHPIAAIMLVNDTGASLPKGILTVYDESEGYVGDSQISGMPDGERRMASFATDKKVRIGSSSTPTQEITEIKVVDGILTATTLDRHTTEYAVQGAKDDDRTVVIELPKRPGWEFSSKNHLDGTKTHERLKVKVGAGETKTVTATFERTYNQTFRLVHTDAAQLLSLVAGKPGGAEARKLIEIAELQRTRTQIDQQLGYLQQERQRHVTDQERHRENLRAVSEEHALYASSLGKLEASEKRIGHIDSEAGKLIEQKQAIADKIGEAIRNF